MGSLLRASAFDGVSAGPHGPLIAKLSVKNAFQQRPALDHKPGLASKVKLFEKCFKTEDI